MARAFWRDARILVLDEPSSSLDPIAEAELTSQFRALLGGRSAIVISHRLSTVQMADRIYVLDRGLTRSGGHLRKGGYDVHDERSSPNPQNATGLVGSSGDLRTCNARPSCWRCVKRGSPSEKAEAGWRN
jgi:ABC-type protease/lipase transport system fused ATPase/permease subunit